MRHKNQDGNIGKRRKPEAVRLFVKKFTHKSPQQKAEWVVRILGWVLVCTAALYGLAVKARNYF